MLSYSFENHSKQPLYVQLYKAIQNDIIHGVIKANEKLPSKRAFAKNQGISVITVENAYEQLIAEGYVYSKPKKGFFACEINQPQKKALAPSFHLPEEIKDDMIVDFCINQTAKDQFPFSNWAKIIRNVLSLKQDELLTNPPIGGVLELRESLANYLREFRGMNVSPRQIVIGSGTESLYGILILLLGRDCLYGVENPGYKKLSKILESQGVNYAPLHMTFEGVDVNDMIQRKIDVLHVSPSHHFPTGIVTPITKRYELLSWASKNEKRYIIEDDYDSEFKMTGKMIPTLQSIDHNEKVIYMNTFNKALASTIRMSYMVLPLHLLQKYEESFSYYSCTVPTLQQYALSSFIDEGYFEKHINRKRTLYHKKRDELLNALKDSRHKDDLDIYMEDAGLHFILKIKRKPSNKIIDYMKKRKIKMNPLSQYDLDGSCELDGLFLISYASLNTDQINLFIRSLDDVLDMI